MEKSAINRLEFTRDKIKQFFASKKLWYLLGISGGVLSVAYFSQLLFKQVNFHIFTIKTILVGQSE